MTQRQNISIIKLTFCQYNALQLQTKREIIKHGLDIGINFYDTAIVYQNGTSEQYVGRALRDFA